MRAIAVLTALLLAILFAPGSPASPVSGTLPVTVNSVGRLLVPAVRYRDGYPQHYDEQCSATLIRTDAGDRHSDLILSAWHCVEDYRDLSRPLAFVSAAGEKRQATVLISGGSMYSDWVLLRLQGSLPDPVGLATEASHGEARLLMAGYPRATNQSAPQTAQCRVTGREHRDWRSDCVLSKGASGGAVFAADSLMLVGVISRGDSVSQSIFVPLTRFLARIRPYLRTPDLRVPSH